MVPYQVPSSQIFACIYFRVHLFSRAFIFAGIFFRGHLFSRAFFFADILFRGHFFSRAFIFANEEILNFAAINFREWEKIDFARNGLRVLKKVNVVHRPDNAIMISCRNTV